MPQGTTPGSQTAVVPGEVVQSSDETNAALDEVSKAIDAAFAEFDLPNGQSTDG
jgi:hypothetical protein